MSDFTFVIPNPSNFISGGNSYNRQLIEAIDGFGASVSHIPYEQFKDQSSHQSRYIFDSIYFESIQADQIKIPNGSIGLIHHLASLFPLSSAMFQSIDRPILQKFAALIVTSQFTKKHLQANGVVGPIVVIEPALKVVNKRVQNHTDKINALMVNNVIPRKGVLPFLEALALEKIPPDYRLQIAGDMNSDKEYSLACTEMVLKDNLLKRTVKFTGLQDDLTIDKLYSRSNLFISASYMETFGMSIQEASLHGIPLLILEGGNSSSHVAMGVNGWVEKSMTDLVKRFTKIIAHQDQFIDIQQNAVGYKHPYLDSYRNGAKLFLDFARAGFV